jgi:hypothetical protein
MLGLSYPSDHTSTDRWLTQNDPLRTGLGPELAPPARTKEEVCRQAIESDASAYAWTGKAHPRNKSGVNTWCPLSVLSKFNMIWDFTPDMMHIIKTFFERLLFGVFSGNRRAKFTLEKPVQVSDPTKAQKVAFSKRNRKYNKDAREFKKDMLTQDACLFTKKQQEEVDERVKKLVGFPDWIKSSMVGYTYSTWHSQVILRIFLT